jgi:succinylarginine dihydrolase
VVADPATVDPRFLLDAASVELIEAAVRQYWPPEIAPADLEAPALWRDVRKARAKLLEALNLNELR